MLAVCTTTGKSRERRCSERLHHDGEEQGEVLGAADGKLVGGVVVDDLGEGVERRAVLPQDVLALFGQRELHVHEAVAAPVET